MINTKNEMLTQLGAALDFEKQAVSKYKEFGEQTNDAFGKIVFTKLSEEEEKHVEIIQNMIDSVNDSDVLTNATFDSSTKLERITQFKISDMVDEKPKSITKNYISAIDFAIKFEQKSYEFYSNLMANTTNRLLKRAFNDLTKFEEGHVILFKEVKEMLLMDPSELLSD